MNLHVSDVDNDPLEPGSDEASPGDVQLEVCHDTGDEAQTVQSTGPVCDQAKEVPAVQEGDVIEQQEQKDYSKDTRESSDVEIISSAESNTGENHNFHVSSSSNIL